MALHYLHGAAREVVAEGLRVPLGGCLVRGLPQDHAGNPTKAVVLVPLPPAGVRLRSPRSPRALVVRSVGKSTQRISQNVEMILVENHGFTIETTSEI